MDVDVPSVSMQAVKTGVKSTGFAAMVSGHLSYWLIHATTATLSVGLSPPLWPVLCPELEGQSRYGENTYLRPGRVCLGQLVCIHISG